MLVLADRNFLSHTLARDVLATGAHILWRASASFRLTPIAVLADGSYLALLHPRRKADGPPITVRVIEYTVHTSRPDGAEDSSEVFALVTDLLDPEAYPALDLACAYPMRWGCETVIGHHKTDMGAGHGGAAQQRPRGRRPGDVGAVRGLPGHPHPDRRRHRRHRHPTRKISFPHALAAATDSVTAGFPPSRLDLALATFLLKILDPGSSSATARPGQPTGHQEGRRLPRPQRSTQRRPRHPHASRSTASARSLAGLLAEFRPCFTAPTFHTFIGLVVGLVAQTRRRTVCGMLTGAGLDQVWHHSRAHRLFTTARWSGDALGLAMADLIVARLLPAGAALTIAVDDTLFKRSGKKVFGAAWHHDGAAKGPKPIGFGNCWVVAGIIVQLPFLSARCACRCWPGSGDPATPERSRTPASWPS